MYKHSIIDCYPRLLDNDITATPSSPGTRSGPPSACESSVSSDDQTPPAKSSKTFQDVTVFREIAARMPPKSLLHLLQGMHSTDDFCGKLPSIVQHGPTEGRVQFQENEDGGIKCTVFMIPRISDPKLWWQSDEIRNIRTGCAALADHYRQYQKDYINAIHELMDSDCTSSQSITQAMKCIMNKSICRGLESHIVAECRHNCKLHRRRVLEAQEEVDDCSDDDTEIEWDMIRQASCEESRSSAMLAYKLAQYDALQVLDNAAWEHDMSESLVDASVSLRDEVSESLAHAEDLSESLAECSLLSEDVSESTAEVTSLPDDEDESESIALSEDFSESLASLSSNDVSGSLSSGSVWSDLSESIVEGY